TGGIPEAPVGFVSVRLPARTADSFPAVPNFCAEPFSVTVLTGESAVFRDTPFGTDLRAHAETGRDSGRRFVSPRSPPLEVAVDTPITSAPDSAIGYRRCGEIGPQGTGNHPGHSNEYAT